MRILLAFILLPLVCFSKEVPKAAEYHHCQFRKDTQRLQVGQTIPKQTSVITDKITVPEIAFSQGNAKVRDAQGNVAEEVSYHTGTKEYETEPVPLRYISVNFKINEEAKDLGIVVAPETPTAFAHTSASYKEGDDFVLVTALVRCWLVSAK